MVSMKVVCCHSLAMLEYYHFEVNQPCVCLLHIVLYIRHVCPSCNIVVINILKAIFLHKPFDFAYNRDIYISKDLASSSSAFYQTNTLTCWALSKVFTQMNTWGHKQEL